MENRLVGVSLMDKADNVISLVYFFYDPAWRPQSPGKFSIVTQLDYAKRSRASYAYLGYWVDACQSLHYKSGFTPHELLDEYVPLSVEPQWRRAT